MTPPRWEPCKVQNQEWTGAPLKLKFEGLFGLLLKSDSIKESVIAQRDSESKEKRIFFFLSINGA